LDGQCFGIKLSRVLRTGSTEGSRKSQETRGIIPRSRGRVRGKYYPRATAGTTLVLLAPDVAKTFPDGSSVNEALRTYLRTSRADRDKLPKRLHPVAAR
jgi:hypothetical protein